MVTDSGRTSCPLALNPSTRALVILRGGKLGEETGRSTTPPPERLLNVLLCERKMGLFWCCFNYKSLDFADPPDISDLYSSKCMIVSAKQFFKENALSVPVSDGLSVISVQMASWHLKSSANGVIKKPYGLKKNSRIVRPAFRDWDLVAGVFNANW